MLRYDFEDWVYVGIDQENVARAVQKQVQGVHKCLTYIMWNVDYPKDKIEEEFDK